MSFELKKHRLISISVFIGYSAIYWSIAYPYAKAQTFQFKEYFGLFFIWYHLSLFILYAHGCPVKPPLGLRK